MITLAKIRLNLDNYSSYQKEFDFTGRIRYTNTRVDCKIAFEIKYMQYWTIAYPLWQIWRRHLDQKITKEITEFLDSQNFAFTFDDENIVTIADCTTHLEIYTNTLKSV